MNRPLPLPSDVGQLAMFDEAHATADRGDPARPATTATREDPRPAVTRHHGPIEPTAARLELPPSLQPYRSLLRLGTSSWAFAGWQGLVYAATARAHPESHLSREGLRAYSAHSLFGAVGIDRGFYAPIDRADHERYAAQVPDGFRFLVKAPNQVTDALQRDASGRARGTHDSFLDAGFASERFVRPAVEGLGSRLGTLLFQFAPLPAALLADAPAWIERLGRFLEALPRSLPAGAGYAVELRDPALLTPRLVDCLRQVGVDYCLGLHDRMPPVARQLQARARLHRGHPGPLVTRWSLHAGLGYEAARRRYAPFGALVDPDPVTREPLARAAADTLRAGQPVTIIANNKAEGSAPLTLAALADAIAGALDAD
jgi:uncharacterized protein YecE (DUF72 family)